ncbi:MAG TPA: amidase family protein [Bacteroidales bacterium]|nr:MAG: Glutamyl-tRNA(Gln) amidotransferase subunit A [Bacteroidetes bacterium ADurb.Bin139]HOG25168.1 amidase family protein [Bacteroidales bacterium]HOR11497.1 amidase family protein [Bacteroidales bacterium]HOZ19504.1 amidase family protein [Bacteroidales bacterium]HPB78187.1 amidase family protein [Bacteroidales bacterium]
MKKMKYDLCFFIMRTFYIPVLMLLMLAACNQRPQAVIPEWIPYNESEEIAGNADHESVKMRFRLIQSRVLDKNELWRVVEPQLGKFTEEDYQRLKPLILGQDIPTLQSHICTGDLTYEQLTQWYLYRIVKFENDRNKMLNAIVAINPHAVTEARAKDRELARFRARDRRIEEQEGAALHLIFGMPILVKDNIGVEGMPTTAGAHVLKDNFTKDAAIIANIRNRGGIILGKTNLSEWANYLFNGGPNGFSAIGGQTLNAYGRRIFDTGGSSSGSGVAMAAGYAAACIGTETSGSILSPSGKSSVVGLKPTVGLLDRSGIVPLAGTLDTPGPMAGTVVDNAILFWAMGGDLSQDEWFAGLTKSLEAVMAAEGSLQKGEKGLTEERKTGLPEGIRFGVNKKMLQNPLYKEQVGILTSLGGIAVEFEPIETDLSGFGTLLSGDMKIDLPAYLEQYAPDPVTIRTIGEIVAYNKLDSLVRIPYGQEIFEEMAALEITSQALGQIRERIQLEGRRYFETPMDTYQLDVILSVDNLEAAYAAAANFPCLIVPMGYTENKGPTGLTFIARSFEESRLLQIGYAFEQATRARKLPPDYQ